MKHSFILNGKPVELDFEPQETLAEVLRNRCHLTGLKVSCEVQVCGACTALVDGLPVSACTYLAYEARGRRVTTIEGIGDSERLHPIQKAFLDEFAFQCGFCTPGMILSAKALLEENPEPTDAEVVSYMDGNLCRCTGYRPILKAIRRAAGLSGSDLHGIDPYYGHAVKDHPLLAIGKVRFLGEPVAAIVAEDERSAYDALEPVRVDYEELPAVLDVDSALAGGAPLVHEMAYRTGGFRGFDDPASTQPGNICQKIHLEWGDAAAAFTGAAHTVEGEFFFPMAYAYAMEPYVAIADYNDDGLTVYSSAQHPFIVRNDLAKIFGLALNRVRLIIPFVGGGYGSKSYTKIEPLTAVCSWKVKRPVKLQLSVEEAMLTTLNYDAPVRIRMAADRRGRFIGLEATIHLNTGAYAENSPLVARRAANRVIGPYRIPNVKVDCYAVYTNTIPASSFRGFGATHSTFPRESQIDELAERLGCDPIELRRKNLAARGETIHPGLRPLDADLAGDLSMLAEALAERTLPKGHGRAVGCSASDAGSDPVSSAVVQVYGDGSVSVVMGDRKSVV